MKINTVILAAGKGTRMQSDKSKLVHEVWGKPMITRVVETAQKINSQKDIIVVGYKKEEVQEVLKNKENLVFVEQKEQLGTGHAVMQAIDEIEDDSIVLTLFGDCPLISKELLSNIVNRHLEGSNIATVLTSIKENPTGYGRIVRDENNNFIKIVEERDCTYEEKLIRETNVGIFCIDAKELKEGLKKIKNNNTQKEYYLTDLIEVFTNEKKKVSTFQVFNDIETRGVNDKAELEFATSHIRKRINEEHMKNGVIIIDSRTTYIDEDVQIGKDTIIYPNTIIKAGTKIGEKVQIGYNSYIKKNSKIKSDKKIGKIF